MIGVALSYVCAGVCFFGGLHHLRVALRLRRRTEGLLLSASAVAFGVFCVLVAGSLRPLSPSEAENVVRSLVNFGMGGVLLQGWFVQRRLGEADGALRWVTLGAVATLMVNTAAPGGLIFQDFARVAGQPVEPLTLRRLPAPDPDLLGRALLVLALSGPAAVLLPALLRRLRGQDRSEALALLAVLLTPSILLALRVVTLSPRGMALPFGPPTLAMTTLLTSAVASVDVGNRGRFLTVRRRDDALVRELVETAPEAIAVYDVDTRRLLAVNPRTEQLLGRTREELLTGDPRSFWAGSGPEAEERVSRAEALLARCLAGETVTADWVTVFPDGRELPCELRMAAARYGDRTLLRASFLDLSERRAREAEQLRIEEELRRAEELETLGRLAGGLAHDFNNFLTPVLAYADAARAEAGDHPARVHLEEVVRGARLCGDLAWRLLLLGRREVPKQEKVSFVPCVRRAGDLLRAALPPELRLSVDPDGGEGVVEASGPLLERVVIDVGMHAARTVPEGGGLDLRAGGDARHLTLTVTSPRGRLPDQVRRRLFEPFPEPDSRESREDGLALSVARGVVTAWGGSLQVTDRPGEGVVYRLELPRVQGSVPAGGDAGRWS